MLISNPLGFTPEIIVEITRLGRRIIEARIRYSG
jgi:hypothetical protein